MSTSDTDITAAVDSATPAAQHAVEAHFSLGQTLLHLEQEVVSGAQTIAQDLVDQIKDLRQSLENFFGITGTSAVVAEDTTTPDADTIVSQDPDTTEDAPVVETPVVESADVAQDDPVVDTVQTEAPAVIVTPDGAPPVDKDDAPVAG